MWRIIPSICRRSGPHDPQDRLSDWYNPSAAPSTPIFRNSNIGYSSRHLRVHWWNLDTACFRGAPWSPQYGSLPVCGFFTPSNSYTSAPNEFPWLTATPTTTDDGHTDILSETQADTGNRNSRNLSGARPLMRVLTINRKNGESIRRRRKIWKIIPPEEIVLGLGMIFSDRSTSIIYDVWDESVEESPVEENWLTVRNLTEEIEDSDDDW